MSYVTHRTLVSLLFGAINLEFYDLYPDGQFLQLILLYIIICLNNPDNGFLTGRTVTWNMGESENNRPVSFYKYPTRNTSFDASVKERPQTLLVPSEEIFKHVLCNKHV